MGAANTQGCNGRDGTNQHHDCDQDRAMKATIAQVFPCATHRCCKFYVVSKACEKFGWLIRNNLDFADEFDYCINFTESPEEFEMLWHNVEVKYDLHGNEHF